jgi:hypothetical protein
MFVSAELRPFGWNNVERSIAPRLVISQAAMLICKAFIIYFSPKCLIDSSPSVISEMAAK